MRRCVVTAWALLVLSLVASSVGAQERSLEIVEGKTTKAEIRALYGPPDYWNEQGDLIYDASELKPPLPARASGRSLHQRMTLATLAMLERARAALDLVEPAIGREFVDDAIRRLEAAMAAQDDVLDDDAGRPEPRGTSRDLGAH